MSKSKPRIDDKQITIFEYLQRISEQSARPASTEGSMKIIDRLRESLRHAIKNCPLSRHQVSGEMSHLTGDTITKTLIDSWTRESDEINGRPGRHIPAEYLPAFCRATGSNEPMVIMGRMTGLFVLPGPEALRAEIQRLDEQAAEIRAEKSKRKMFLREMENERV